MLTQQPLSLIIPAYNEERRLPATLEIIQKWAPQSSFDLEVIVVDDGSADRTVDVVQQYMKQMPYLNLVRSNHVGYMNAIITGFNAAKKDLIASLEADCPVHPEMFDSFSRRLNEYDVVMGSRVSDEADVQGKSVFRRILSRGMTTLFVILFRCGVRDPQIGFKLFKAEVLKKVLPQLRLRHDGLKASEILVKAHAFGYRIKEVPVKYKHDEDSRCVPKGNYAVVFEAARNLFALWSQSYQEFKLDLLPQNPVRFGWMTRFFLKRHDLKFLKGSTAA